MQSGMDRETVSDVDDHQALRLWLRLLTCSQLIERQVRARLRERFDTTLPRFDLMSQLWRYPEGLKMNELSRHLMVTGGNVTGLTDDLEKDGTVVRENSPGDRRAWIVRLTAKGRRRFETMANEHEGRLLELFAGLDAATVRQLHGQLGRLRVHLVRHNESSPDEKKS